MYKFMKISICYPVGDISPPKQIIPQHSTVNFDIIVTSWPMEICKNYSQFIYIKKTVLESR